MWHKAIYALVLALLLALTLLLLPGDQARAQRHDEAEPVEVVNFPPTQRVTGEVKVGEPVPAAALVSLGEVLAVPAAREDTAQLVPAGVVSTAGWTRAVLSLTGEARGRGAAGAVGALLVPDEELANAAFNDGRLLFPLEVTAPVSATGRWVESPPTEVRIAFPRYRVYLYNTSERSVASRVFVYLTQ